MEDMTVRQPWKVKYLYVPTFDRYTDNPMLLLGRSPAYVVWTALIGGGILTYYR
jgi:hypothetical protein